MSTGQTTHAIDRTAWYRLQDWIAGCDQWVTGPPAPAIQVFKTIDPRMHGRNCFGSIQFKSGCFGENTVNQGTLTGAGNPTNEREQSQWNGDVHMFQILSTRRGDL